ncbi:LysM peptidoglycan-binding domain-containing protein [Maribellus mangrovi]|uniref:LysM peptidoglycan-binding domain-containing protein n=1 Tax=Maribellus mangrovi TaxID=3133146 RepID=UPI0030EC0927
MKFILSVIFISLLFVGIEPVSGQNLRENEIVVISGEKFILHEVKTGETIYSLTKKYKVDRAELEKHNPGLAKGPSIGDILKIPYKEGADLSLAESQQKGDPDGFKPYKIQSRRETAYFVAKENGITVEELYKYNPDKKKFKRGTILKIPYWNAPIEKEPETIAGTAEPEMIAHQVVSGETLYSLSKKYEVSETELLRINPNANNLKAGSVLYIPKKKEEETVEEVQPAKNEFSGKYLEHIIESGETLWGTTRRYGVSEAELKTLNPILNTGFPAGAVIKIPVQDAPEPLVKPFNDEAFNTHHVQKGETLYGLSRQFDVSILDLKKYNPLLEQRGLVEGENILIPVKMEETPEDTESENEVISDEPTVPEPDEDFYKVDLTVEIPEDCRPDYTRSFDQQTYNVVLFLPLFLEANDTLNREAVIDSTLLATEAEEEFTGNVVDFMADTTFQDTIEVEHIEVFKKFYGNTENFVQFYEGVLLALDHLKLQGRDVQLKVFDTQRSADSILQYISDPDFLNTDLIIGPIYPDVQAPVSQIAAKNRIPMVSPLASQSRLIQTNPYYFQVNPSREYLGVETAEMVAEEYYNSNFIVLKTEDYSRTEEGKLVNLLQEKFFNAGLMSQREGVNFTIYDFKNEGPFGLRRIMSKSKENVVYIPDSNEGSLSIAISNVNNLASDYSITLIGSHRFPSFQSIQIDHFHNLKLKYIAPYWIDYSNQNTIAFIEDFKTNYGTEPDNFGIQGYDVTSYFLKAISGFGKEFADCLPYFHVDLIQGNYHFEKYSQFGGYMNQGVSVISYTRDYEVKRERVKGQPRLVIANSYE